MQDIQALLRTEGLASAIPESVAATLSQPTGVDVIAQSLVAGNGVLAAIARAPEGGKCLVTVSERDVRVEGAMLRIEGVDVCVSPLTAPNAAAVRACLPVLKPRPLGLATSIGMGDRLGLATPGHVRAVRGSGLAPVFAQQSIREMTRTGRSPQDVVDDAMWGVLEEGWAEGYGADADHLKSTEDIDACAAAGFVMFTIDPGAHVDDAANSAPASELAGAFEALPWEALESTPSDCRSAYLGKSFALDGGDPLDVSEEALLRAAAKYGRAIAHTAMMHRHLARVKGDEPFELEMSVDETATPTTPVEHYFVAAELKRLGVEWVSLAPRFVGEFEKGVDFIGDLAAFERSFAQHAAIARTLGPYKLSIHSGSDKFSVYPIAARLAGDLVHVKTAGTSYLEALRAIARVEPDLFREILDFARGRYDEDRATYHVSAELAKVPDATSEGILDDFHAREVLHVTYGSVLASGFRDRFFAALRENEDVYADVLERHLGRHVAPFRKERK